MILKTTFKANCLTLILMILVSGCSPEGKMVFANKKDRLEKMRAIKGRKYKLENTRLVKAKKPSKESLLIDENDYSAKDIWDHERYLRLSSKDRSSLTLLNNGKISKEGCGENIDWQRATMNQGKANLSFDEVTKKASQGDIHAFVRLAEMHMLGEGVARSPSKALYWHTKAANKGMIYSQITLGNMYRDGHGVNKSISRARNWYERAANQNSIHAMLLLGESYEGWFSDSIDLDKAEQWFARAACLGSQGAIQKMARIGDNSPSNSLLSLINNNKDDKNNNNNDDLLNKNKESKTSDKQKLTTYYSKDTDKYQKESAMISSYTKSTNSNNANSSYQLGTNYLNGEVLHYDPTSAMYWIAKSAHLNYAPAQYQLGTMYHNGHGVPRDLKLAKSWYEKAAKKNFALAQARLGDMYHRGEGVPRYLETAAYWYQEAAENSDAYSQYMLSIMYETGRGVTRDLCRSTGWYKLAELNKLNFVALTEVARDWELGLGLPKDLSQAKRWYNRAANKSYAPAKNALADLYLRDDVEHNDVNVKNALKWYISASQQGSAYAEYCLGVHYLQEDSKDLTKAGNWLKLAAKKGHRPAQFELGRMYFKGEGLKQNDVRAYGWWSIALAEHNELTPDNMAYLIDKMEPDTKAKALELSARYKSRYGSVPNDDIYALNGVNKSIPKK